MRYKIIIRVLFTLITTSYASDTDLKFYQLKPLTTQQTVNVFDLVAVQKNKLDGITLRKIVKKVY